MKPDGHTLGLSGRIARRFLTTEITPLLAITGLLLGLFAVIVTPREEEPQINVTFANVFIAVPGASAKEVESLVTGPAEQIASEIEGVEHIYSASQPGMALLTVRYRVGEPRNEAIVRLYNAFYQHADRLPQGAGVMPPLIQPRGIDDVPIFAVTLWSDDAAVDSPGLLRVAHALENELQRVPGARNVNTIGAPDRVVRISLDPQRLAAYGLDIDDLQRALNAANSSLEAGSLVRDNHETLLQAGSFLATPEDAAAVVVGVRNGAPIYLRDVAEVRAGSDWPARYAKFGVGPAHAAADTTVRVPALTLTVGKKPGENAVKIAAALDARLAALRGIVIPDAVHVSVTRDYGLTAQDKAQTLIKKLVFATASVIVLVLLALGRREAIVVGAAVVATLMITLFASWAWGFTLNRVSLFALIFSIGILVDDAIVVVENIHRHMSHGDRSLTEAIPAAVDEVGGPTILATFAVIAALLPMAFVSGLMGPYMRPIPINASTGMLISLAVAFVFTPWLYRRLFLNRQQAHAAGDDRMAQRLHAFFTRVMTPFLRGRDGRGQRVRLLVVLLLLIAASVSLVGFKAVILKMLPLDNKSEFQVLVDMPEGTPLEQTARVLDALADFVQTIPEVTDYQIYAGTAAPINFNGLVRQYDLRSAPYQGDIQVNLLDKHLRHRKSHEIAQAARAPLAAIGAGLGATVTIVEVPPGPPVQAPLVAEIYGLDYSRQQDVARQVRAVFAATPNIVDIDDSIVAAQPRLIAQIDRVRAAQLGISQQQVSSAIAAAVGGRNLSWLHDEQARVAVPLRLQLPAAERADPDVLGALRLRTANGTLVPLSDVVQLRQSTREPTIFHKDLMPVVYVTGDVAGGSDSPLYGLRVIAATLGKTPIEGSPIEQFFTQQPDNPYRWSMKWDGEWQITYETFRDMGLAYSVGLILIYLLVVAQFRSYTLPLIIMAPIPMTIAGILPGHALLGQQFTAPSMIGMIALAGIIVRNSILLVDFIEQEVRAGKPLQQATIEAAAVRARPIALTAMAAMAGGFFIIDDPIFGGLAVSLIFGLLVSTVLTLLVVPVVYYAYHWRAEARAQNAP